MIKHVSMKHGWFYYYRIHTEKSKELLNDRFSNLYNYLEEVYESCPHEHFTTGPRSSSLKFDVNKNFEEVQNHETCILADSALENMKKYSTAHSKVEVFMLERDDKTIAVEVPIWIMPNELKNFSKLFNSDLPLSGHIDILRVEDNRIWIWDYKPKANKEKYAHVQTLFYAVMLSKRSGIDLKHFRCGYFDENTCFVFQPTLDMLPSKV